MGSNGPSCKLLFPCEENCVKAIVDLFSTDYGLFSIAGILFMIGMAIWFYRFFTRKMNESAGQNP